MRTCVTEKPSLVLLDLSVQICMQANLQGPISLRRRIDSVPELRSDFNDYFGIL